MQHLGSPYFSVDGVYYQGSEKELKERYATYLEEYEGLTPNSFEKWCKWEVLEVEEYYTNIDDDYLICTDEEADEKAAEYIKESVWAFNADFIVDHSNLPYEAIDMIKHFQSTKCEDANETILALITDFDDFVSDAISADGRGHFLSTYDGEENEETVNGETYYIYRQ